MSLRDESKKGENKMWPFIKKKKKNVSEIFEHKYYVNDKISDSPKYDLAMLYERCVEEMTLQQAKRDQIFTLYLAMFSFLVPFALSTAGIGDIAKGAIFIALAIIGWMFALIIERYRIYKESYWLCCQAITCLMSFKEGSIDKKTVQAVYYSCLFKKGEKYIDKKNNKYKRLDFYKGNIFSGETIYYLIHSFITSIMVYLGINQMFYNNSKITESLLNISGVLCAVIVFVILTIFYFERLLEVYSVLVENTEKAFNKAFSKAWFLHFYMENSKYSLVTVDNTLGRVLKRKIDDFKTFVHHIKDGETLEIKESENGYYIFIVCQGTVLVNQDNTLYEKGVCAFNHKEDIKIKSVDDSVVLEINVINSKENNNLKLPYFKNYAKNKDFKILEEGIVPCVKIENMNLKTPKIKEYNENTLSERFIYSFDDNECILEIDEELIKLGQNTLFHIPYNKKFKVIVCEKQKAHGMIIEYKR